METFDVIHTRRSTRAYTQEPVAEASVAKILEAGRVAPCGGNTQLVHFIVLRNKQVLADLAALVEQVCAQMEVDPKMPIPIQTIISKSKKGGYVFHYGAPVLIVTASKISWANAMADCSCAMENMMLMANELNLGSCWINQLHWLDQNQVIREQMLKLGLASDETVCASLAIGHPASSDGLPNRSARKIIGNPVTYVD